MEKCLGVDNFYKILIWILGIVEVIWHNWTKSGPNMGVAAPRAPVGGLGRRSTTSSKVWSWVLVDWATDISKKISKKNQENVYSLVKKADI